MYDDITYRPPCRNNINIQEGNIVLANCVYQCVIYMIWNQYGSHYLYQNLTIIVSYILELRLCSFSYNLLPWNCFWLVYITSVYYDSRKFNDPKCITKLARMSRVGHNAKSIENMYNSVTDSLKILTKLFEHFAHSTNGRRFKNWACDASMVCRVCVCEKQDIDSCLAVYESGLAVRVRESVRFSIHK
jgi:hypothetical protein